MTPTIAATLSFVPYIWGAYIYWDGIYNITANDTEIQSIYSYVNYPVGIMMLMGWDPYSGDPGFSGTGQIACRDSAPVRPDEADCRLDAYIDAIPYLVAMAGVTTNLYTRVGWFEIPGNWESYETMAIQVPTLYPKPELSGSVLVDGSTMTISVDPLSTMGNVMARPTTNYSGNAVLLPAGGQAVFEFDSPPSGPITFETSVMGYQYGYYDSHDDPGTWADWVPFTIMLEEQPAPITDTLYEDRGGFSSMFSASSRRKV